MFTDDIVDTINKQEYVGIRLSGGIDSAVLCYIVLKYFPHINLLPITFYNKLRPIAQSSVDNVLRVLSELNPGNRLMQQEVGIFDTTGYIKLTDAAGPSIHPKDVFQRKFVDELFNRHGDKLNVILSGETLNPPLDVQRKLGVEDQFMKGRNDPRENLVSLYNHRGIQKFEYSPFRNCNKRQIAEVCKDLGLMGTLFPVSETCETEPEKYNTPYVKSFGLEYDRPGIEPCQSCWPCREKYWAYGVFDFNTPSRANINLA